MQPSTQRSAQRSARLAALVATISLDASGCSGDDTEAMNVSVDWQTCDDEPTPDCGVLEVPLIHDAPDGRTLAIDLVRLRATGDGATEPLLVNPGGPGGSGTVLVRESADRDELPEALRTRFDVIGFDPRGIGASDRIDCEHYGIEDADPYPRDRDALVSVLAETRAVAEACVAEYGDQLQWLGSNSVVRDMEVLRVALDAPVITAQAHAVASTLGRNSATAQRSISTVAGSATDVAHDPSIAGLVRH